MPYPGDKTLRPITLAFDMPHILATGADLKNAICLTKGRKAFLSQDLGNLENVEAHRTFEETIGHLQHLLDIKPEIIACDLHPDYFSSRYAQRNMHNAIRVQHHHAHIASCMADNDLPNEKVIGIALDGTGFGTDATIWGGEVLVADYEGFERAAHFKPVPLPGGDAAAKEPWRMAAAHMWVETQSSKFKVQNIKEPLGQIDPTKIELILQMLDRNINCPLTSSCGRLFDAVAALIGLCTHNTFEAEAPIKLEQIADEKETGCYSFEICERGATSDQQTESSLIDFGPTITSIVEDVQNGTAQEIMSARFHNTLAEALAQTCYKIMNASRSTPHSSRSTPHSSRFTLHASRICLSGGCFQNALLTSKLDTRLRQAGFEVFTHSRVPPNDVGIALGQVAIAVHQLEEQPKCV